MGQRTGEMRERVSIQKYAETRSAMGSSIRDFVTENTVWAKVNPVGAKERLQADQVNSEITHRVSMRFYSPGITSADRLLFGTRKLNIISVIDVGERGCDTVLDVSEQGPEVV